MGLRPRPATLYPAAVEEALLDFRLDVTYATKMVNAARLLHGRARRAARMAIRCQSKA